MAVVETLATPRKDQRNPSGRKPKRRERHPNPWMIGKRNQRIWADLREDRPDDWHKMIPRGAHEGHGSAIGRLYMRSEIDVPQADAGRHYAMLAGQYDRFFATAPRQVRGLTYERSYRGMDDEVERRMRNGTIAAYERRARAIKKQWRRLQARLSDEMRNLLDRVCIEDQDPSFTEMPAVRAGLAILASHAVARKPKLLTHHEPGAKLGSKGRATWPNRKR